MTNFSVWLPFPPSVNNLFRDLSPETRIKISAGMARNGKRGRAPTRVISSEYKAWREEAAIRIKSARPRAHFTTDAAAAIELVPPDNRRRDVDNYSKAIFDVLVVANVLEDDCQIKDLRVKMLPASGHRAGATIHLRALDYGALPGLEGAPGDRDEEAA